MDKLKKVVVIVGVLFALGSMTGCYSTPEGGQILVVRNGGPFDNHNIRQVVCPNASRTGTGVSSEAHPYPADSQQRIYKLDVSEDADAKPPLVRTADGVNARIAGTFYINTAFNCSTEGKKLVQDFDNQFGTRTFGTNGHHPWENFSDFLNSVVQPVIDSNMREIIAEFQCKQLVSSCALVQNSQSQAVKVDPNAANNKSNVQQIQDRVQQGLAADLNAKLGHAYFTDIKFNLQPVELPEVDDAIGQAQSAFAEVSKQQAEVAKAKVKVLQARQDKLANQQRQKGYQACPACAKIDELRALPQGLQVLGGNAAVTLGR